MFVFVSATWRQRLSATAGVLAMLIPPATTASADALREFSVSLSAYRHVSLVADVERTFTSTLRPSRSDTLPAKLVYRSHPEFLFLSHRHVNLDGVWIATEREFHINENELLNFQAPLSRADDNTSSTGRVSIVMVNPRVASHVGSADLRFFDPINDASLACGVLAHIPLLEYLSDPTVIHATASAGFVEVRSEFTHGELSLLLDPQFGFLPVRLKLVRGPHHMHLGALLASLSMTGDGKLWPKGRVNRIVWSADQIQLSREGDRPYIKQFELIQNVFAESGDVVTIKTAVVVSDFEFEPGHDSSQYRTSLEIPEDSAVTIRGAPQLRYVWREGRPTPAVESVDVSVEASLGRSGAPRLLLLVALNVAGFIMAWWLCILVKRRIGQ